MPETWITIAEKCCEYEEEIDGKAFFDKVISIWREYPNAISTRITTAIKVDLESTVGQEVLNSAENQLGNDAELHNEIEVWKFITRELKRDQRKRYSENAFEISFYDESTLVRFLPVTLDGLENPWFISPYSIGCQILNEKTLNIQILKPLHAPEENYTYLKNEGFAKLQSWIKNVDLSKETRKTNSLMDKESYHKTYRYVRNTYGRPICETWTEKSNAEKSVFEDCAITAYILESIQLNNLPKPRKFVDLGCGNGLLVHLLNKCGVPGYGVDVRSRKIWKNKFRSDDLRETTVDPQLVVSHQPHLDKDVDLLIGNHSDELTPWIPVMAAKLRSSFFVIPCCPFNFFGKYINNGSHLGARRFVSQYESFFEWTVSVAQRLGFEVKIDRLAIPSTKRLCIIGKIPEDGLATNVDEIIDILTEGKTFIARPHEIKSKNCMNIAIPDRERIAKMMFEYILEKGEKIEGVWQAGGIVPLSELAGILNEDDKNLMKAQCGGLQTFLRNNHQIFHVYGGNARLRDLRNPDTRKKTKPNQSRMKAACWMAANHPNGCPVGAERCHFSH